MPELTEVTIYTDGACRGNPGPGGYAAVLLCKGRRREISGGRRLTTNNRMEILALIEAMATLKWPCCVTAYSDSRYLVDSVMQGHLLRWLDRGWRTDSGAVKNIDLW